MRRNAPPVSPFRHKRGDVAGGAADIAAAKAIDADVAKAFARYGMN